MGPAPSRRLREHLGFDCRRQDWREAIVEITKRGGISIGNALSQPWEDVPDTSGLRESAQIFHVGWSPSRKRFVAYGFDSRNALEPEDLTDRGFFCFPPVEEPPADLGDDDGWIQLARHIRTRYSVASKVSGEQVTIGGDVIHTRLERGIATQRRIHTFHENTQEHRLMMVGIRRPLG